MTNRTWSITALVGAAIAMFSVRAEADVLIDFNAAPAEAVTEYTESGATIRAVGGGSFMKGLAPNGTTALIEMSRPRREFRVDFEDWADAISIDLGDFGSDADLLVLEAFDTWGGSLGSASALLDAGEAGMRTLAIVVPAIKWAIFGARAPAGGGNSAYADNLRFVPNPVPGLGSLALSTIAMPLGLAFRRLGRRRAS